MYGLYVHIPFCRKKCNYCDFISQPEQEKIFSKYIKALNKESKKYADLKISTIYIGGGTPSILSEKHLDNLFVNIYKNFNIENLSEITFETNPESITESKLKTLKHLGVNRLSIGVQSLIDDELKFLGRIHTANDVIAAFKKARKAGFDNINIDLIYGLPYQTERLWQNNLREALLLQSEHISLYPLTIEPSTVFHINSVEIKEDSQGNMYEWSMEHLEKRGYEHYEISNWALTKHYCKHNLIYWRNMEYIGLGVSAASYLNGLRYKNTNDLNHYLRSNKKIVEEENIDLNRKISDEIMLGLRCRSGVNIKPEIYDKYSKPIERFISELLLEKDGENIKLTKVFVYWPKVSSNAFSYCKIILTDLKT
ncbi:radical SAM family heme chaperone HemW [Elusimicrobiota bacterium]